MLRQTYSIMEKKLAINKRVKGGFLLIKNKQKSRI